MRIEMFYQYYVILSERIFVNGDFCRFKTSSFPEQICLKLQARFRRLYIILPLI